MNSRELLQQTSNQQNEGRWRSIVLNEVITKRGGPRVIFLSLFMTFMMTMDLFFGCIFGL